MKRVNHHKKSWNINWSAPKSKVKRRAKIDKKYRCVIKKPRKKRGDPMIIENFDA